MDRDQDQVASELRKLSDRLRSVGSAAHVAAHALLNSEPDETQSSAAEILMLHVCEPLTVEIGQIERMAKAYVRKPKGQPASATPARKKKSKARR